MNLFKDMFIESVQSLSSKETYIFDFIASNINLVCSMNIKELSLKLNVTEYSINKFCKKINVDNFENLIEILKELLKNFSEYSNLTFKKSIENILNFTKQINEMQISKICDLILKYKNILILFSDSSKLIAQYMNQNLNSLEIFSKTTSSTKQIAKQKDINLIIYISSNSNEKTMTSTLKNIFNKVIITISDTMTKDAHDNSSIFVHLPSSKTLKNFNVNCNGLFFAYIDLIISKIIELMNIKN